MTPRNDAPPTVAVLNGRRTIIDADVLAPMFWGALDLVLAAPYTPRMPTNMLMAVADSVKRMDENKP